MVESRLLERILHTAYPYLITGVASDTLLKQSISRHLTRLLNTRQGSVPIDSKYGLTDMNNIAGSLAMGTSEEICEQIIWQIRQYEPRLQNPVITSIKEENQIVTLKFELSAQIARDDKQLSGDIFSMYLRINSAGRIQIEARRDR
jgi:type VI secretion system protein